MSGWDLPLCLLWLQSLSHSNSMSSEEELKGTFSDYIFYITDLGNCVCTCVYIIVCRYWWCSFCFRNKVRLPYSLCLLTFFGLVDGCISCCLAIIVFLISNITTPHLLSVYRSPHNCTVPRFSTLILFTRFDVSTSSTLNWTGRCHGFDVTTCQVISQPLWCSRHLGYFF